MAIDWTKIEGYREDMTAEERLALLDDMDVAPKGTTVLKSVFDKTSSDLAAAKKEIKKRMSDDEQRDAERAAEDSAFREELAELKKREAIRDRKMSLMEMGYDAASAEKLATALHDGDNEAIFGAMKKFNADLEKNLKAQILKDTPHPPAAGEGEKPEDEAVRIAKRIANRNAGTEKAATDILSHYM